MDLKDWVKRQDWFGALVFAICCFASGRIMAVSIRTDSVPGAIAGLVPIFIAFYSKVGT